MGQWQDPYNILGFAGGVVLASSLLPQIYLAHKRKSTADISYMWQGVYIVGLITLLIFYAHFDLWPVFYPLAFELSSILYLTGLKIYYEASKTTETKIPLGLGARGDSRVVLVEVDPALSDTSRTEKPVVGVGADKEAAALGLFGPTAKKLSAEREQREEVNEAGAGDDAGAVVAAGEEEQV